MNEILNLSIKELKNKLNKKEISVDEVLDASYKQMTKHKDLNMYVLETEEFARKQAKESQKRINEGNALLLDGVPVGVKDLYCVEKIRTTACSGILRNFVPEYTSTVAQKLFDNGGIMVGKTNMDDCAMGSANINSFFGKCYSPWKSKSEPNKLLTPGGSSGGSASAVATRSVFASLGSDTGGSVRQPAAFTGLTGIKPTYGRCSRYGMIAFASSLDQAGVFGKDVSDSAIILEAIMGHDQYDSTISYKEVPKLSNLTPGSIKGLKVGIPKEYVLEGISEEIKKMWEDTTAILKSLGAEIIDITLPHTKYALPVYYIVAPAEASSNLARYDGVRYGYRTEQKLSNIQELYMNTRAEGFGREVKRRIMVGTYVLSSEHISSYFNKAQQVRRLVANDFIAAFNNVDVILTPTAPSAAFGSDDIIDPVSMYLNDIFTIPASLAGLPCMSLPVTLNKDGLPLGMQLIANSYREDIMVSAALALEAAIKFNHKPENL